MIIYIYGPPKTDSNENPGLKDLASEKFLYILTDVPSFTTKSPPSFHARSLQLPTH